MRGIKYLRAQLPQQIVCIQNTSSRAKLLLRTKIKGEEECFHEPNFSGEKNY